MASRQKSSRARAAGGRQTTQQPSRREHITSDTGYDSNNKGIVQTRKNKMEDESREKLANYIQETIKDAATLTDLGMLASHNTSQNLTLGQDEDAHDLLLSPHTDEALHNSHIDTPPITTSQRHFGVVNTLSPPVHNSQTDYLNCQLQDMIKQLVMDLPVQQVVITH